MSAQQQNNRSRQGSLSEFQEIHAAMEAMRNTFTPYNAAKLDTILAGITEQDMQAFNLGDDLELFIDGKSVKTLAPTVHFKAEADNEFSQGSGISEFTPTKQQITNLVVGGQFWGFLKYHHFAIAKGDYNWDAELFRFLPKVIVANNNKELSKVLVII